MRSDKAVTRIKSKKGSNPNLFVLLTFGPIFILYCVFTLYPNLVSVIYSLFEWNGISEPKWIGLKNYSTLLGDRYFWNAFTYNILIAIVVPTSVVFLSLSLSSLLAKKLYPESGFYRVLFFFPNIIPFVLLALLWSFVYDGGYGLLNAILSLVGIDTTGFYWLAKPEWARWAVMFPLIWSGVGFNVIIYMNAMAGIPKSFYEAAQIEGANHKQMLWKITMPLISPTVKITYIFAILTAFKNYEFVLLMTNGGPSSATETAGLYIYHMAFGTASGGSRHFGYASALGMVLCVFFVLLKVISERLSKDEGVQY